MLEGAVMDENNEICYQLNARDKVVFFNEGWNGLHLNPERTLAVPCEISAKMQRSVSCIEVF